jgi:regulator of RNase E activity RraA
MTARAAKLGAVGTVISGRLRDIQEHRDAAFPVFARGVGTTAGGGVCFASTIGEPVALQTSIEGVEHESTVHPGDVIVGDANGVVCVPIELAEEVAELVPALAKVDAECLNDVKGGMTVTETFERRRGRLSC